ncbi:MAG TPA: hypothetical protein VK602_00715 [Phyllobacterium sp.]|nr:hypothetical protein [Phyllobacterium sp.]
MSRYRLLLQRMLAENRDQALADIFTELSCIDVIDTATGTMRVNGIQAEAANYPWRDECKRAIAVQLGHLLLDGDDIDFTEETVDGSIEINGTIVIVRKAPKKTHD